MKNILKLSWIPISIAFSSLSKIPTPKSFSVYNGGRYVGTAHENGFEFIGGIIFFFGLIFFASTVTLPIGFFIISFLSIIFGTFYILLFINKYKNIIKGSILLIILSVISGIMSLISGCFMIYGLLIIIYDFIKNFPS